MNILLAFQSIRCPFLDVVFKIFTTLGEEYFIMVLFCWLAWCSDKRFAHKTGFAFCMGMGINQILKIIFCVQRPWVLDSRIKPSEKVLASATGYSFPSGHTQSGITVFGCLALHFKNNAAKILFVLCAAMTGISRLYFGVHTPADVCVSFLIGIAVIFAAEAVYSLCEKHESATALVFTVVSIFMAVFAAIKPYPDYHRPEYMYDCIKIAGAVGGFVISWLLERRFVKSSQTGNTGEKFLRTFVGIIALLLLKLAFKKLFAETYFMMYIQNFVLIMWCVYIYPLIFTKLKKTQVS